MTSQSIGKGALLGGHGKKTFTKRSHKLVKDPFLGLTRPSIRRLARRGGVKRLSADVYDHMREICKIYLENILQRTIIYTEHARRKTISVLDIIYALKCVGYPLYGFNN